jgi:hypothetical protein
MTLDTEKVPADIHTTVEGGLYKNAAGQWTDAHGNVLDENKDEDKQKIEDGQAYAEASAKKREEQAANAPALPGTGLPVSQAELDARIALAVQTALARKDAGVAPTTTASATARGRSSSDK